MLFSCFCLSVALFVWFGLSVCLCPTGYSSWAIFTKLYSQVGTSTGKNMLDFKVMVSKVKVTQANSGDRWSILLVLLFCPRVYVCASVKKRKNYCLEI